MAIDIRTKIAEAMEEMSRTRHPDKISVQDLVNACGFPARPSIIISRTSTP